MGKKFTDFSFGIVFGLSISPLPSFALNLNKTIRENPNYPQSTFTLERAGYVVSYDGRTRGASWVYERLTPESVSKEETNRDGFRFKEDEDLPGFLRATNADYRGSGYDRGHLCPAGDCNGSREAMQSSFLLSNVSPQVASLNRGAWREIEIQVRELARAGKTVHVYTLPLFLASEVEGKREVRYPVIGENNISVPTHFAKVAITEGEDPPLAYILPNKKIESGNLDQSRTTIEKVERAAGMVFPRINSPSQGS